MNKILNFFILFLFISNCSLDTKTGLWSQSEKLSSENENAEEKLFEDTEIYEKEFNTELKIEDEDSKTAFLVFILFIISIFILSSILTLDNLSFESAFKLSILTLTNTTTSSLYGLANLDFFDLNHFTKMSLITFMIFGKIEIIAVIYLIKRFIFRE